MKQNKDKLPDSLITALITHVYIAWGLLYLAKLTTERLTHNAYWSILVALLIITPFYWVVIQLARTYPDLSISQIFSRVFGKPLGVILALVFLLHFGYYEILAFHDSQIMIYTYFFKKTPFALITGVLIAGVLYLALHGAWSVGRLAAFMLFPPFLAIFGLQLLGLSNINPLQLRPVFEGSFENWCLAGVDSVILLLPGTGITIFLPFFKSSDSVKRVQLYSLGMIIPLFIFNILGIVGTFGPVAMKRLNWPTVEYFHVIDFPFLLLEQTGLFFLIAWYASIFVTLCIGAFFLGNELHILFPRIKRAWFTIAYCGALWLLVNIPIGMLAAENLLKRTHTWVAFSFLTLLSALWLVGRVRLGKNAS